MNIEHRLKRIERSNCIWKLACFVLLALIAGRFLVGAEAPSSPAQIVQAKRIELIGADGKAAIVLEAKPEANSLTVWGPDHEHAVVLVAQTRKAAIMLMKDPQSAEVFAEAADAGGQIGVTDGKPTADPATRPSSINLTGGPNGFSLFQLVNGRPASQLSFSNLGGGLELRTPASRAATRILGSDRGGHLEILNQQGNVVWSAPLAAAAK